MGDAMDFFTNQGLGAAIQDLSKVIHKIVQCGLG
jgi:hypothetical protein